MEFCFLFLSFLFFLLVVCILVVFRYLVGAEAGCNCYFRDINIFPLSKKMKKWLQNVVPQVLTSLDIMVC
jgi:hypothetical protein